MSPALVAAAALLGAGPLWQVQAPASGQPAVPMPPGMQLPAVPQPAAPAVPQASPPPSASWEARGSAEIVALDKVDDRMVTLTIPVGQSTTFYHLTIAVRACVVRPADQPADAAAYLDITDARPTQPGFHGWMLANEPSASMLQHPVYDVRLSGCH